MNDLFNLLYADFRYDDIRLWSDGPDGDKYTPYGSLTIGPASGSASSYSITYPDGSAYTFSKDDILEYIDQTFGLGADGVWTEIYPTKNNDNIDLSSAVDLANDEVLHLAVQLTQGDDTIKFPEVDQSLHGYPETLGSITGNWDLVDAYYDADPNFTHDGFLFKFSGDKVTITSNNSLWSGTTTADNVFKVFDSWVTDDTFIGNGGSQHFRSQGGFDKMTGGAGSDRFRIDGSRGLDDPHVYDAIGHQVYITDYSYEDQISIEDFGITSASDISVYTDSGYTYVDVNAGFEDINTTRSQIIKIKGEFDSGVIYQNSSDIDPIEGANFSVKFLDPKQKFIGDNDDNNFSVFGSVWRPDFGVEWFGNPSDYTFDGKDGRDVFSGGQGSDRFIGGDGYDHVHYYDSIYSISVTENGLSYSGADYQKNITISDGMGMGGVDTIDGIERIMGSHFDDRFDLPNNDRDNGIDRILPSYGNDYINAPDAAIGYWDILDSPDDPRIITPAPDGFDGDGSENDNVLGGYIVFDAGEYSGGVGTVQKIIDFDDHPNYGPTSVRFTDTLISYRGISASEGDDILFATLSDDSVSNRWVFGGIGNDYIEDLGSSFDYLIGDDGDDILVSGGFVDTIWGDWRDETNYVPTGDDTFVIAGEEGLAKIKDYEFGENVWWINDGDTNIASVSDMVVTHDYGSNTTKIGYENSDGKLVNRIELNGLLKVDTFESGVSLQSLQDVSNEPSLLGNGANFTLIEDEVIGIKDQDGNLITPYERTVLYSGSDKFYGGSNADWVTTNGGADYVDAGAGDDYIAINGLVNSTDKNPYDGKSNSVIVRTGLGDDIVDVSTNFDGDTTLISGGGIDRLVLNGDAGFYDWATDKNNVVLSSSSSTIVLADQLITDGSVDIFSYIEFISTDPLTGQETSEVFKLDNNAPDLNGAKLVTLGTTSNDALWSDWDSLPGSIVGFGGNDTLEGGFSDDLVNGGAGNDLLFGDSGSDTLVGGEGEDFLFGGHSSDYLFGGSGDDVYKINLGYNGFLDIAGKDNVLLDANGNTDYANTPETPWDIVVGNVDTIVDDGGNDKIWVTNYQPTLNPFDQYKDFAYIDEQGNFVLKWGWDENSSSSYQHTLLEDYEYQIFDPVVSDALTNGGFIATKNNVNNTSEPAEYKWPLFAEEWQAENFLRQINVDNGGDWNDPIPQIVSLNFNPSNVVNVDANGFALKGGALSQTKAEPLEFWAPATYSQSQFPPSGVTELSQTLYYDEIGNEYDQGGDLNALIETGQHTTFDLGRIETWPGFDNLPKFTGTGDPSVGTQEYYINSFVLGDEDSYPSSTDMPFVQVIKDKLVSMEELDSIVDGSWDPANPDNDIISVAEIKNSDAKLEQGFVIENFATKDVNQVWEKTIESIVFTSPTGDQKFVDENGKNIIDGKASGHDSLTKFIAGGHGTEYFLSPSGVVDFGAIPSKFDKEGNPTAYKNEWQGAATDESFILIANTQTAGINDFGIGFNGTTENVTNSGDKNAATPLYLLQDEVITSGAARHDIIWGHDGFEFTDIMFGHGGDDALSALGGQNYVIGGSGADNFVIESLDQKTVIYGDHVKMDQSNPSNPETTYDEDGNEVYTTVNDSYSDEVFFDFAMPQLVSNPDYPANSNQPLISDPNSYIEQLDLAKNHFKVYHDFGDGRIVDVELYDVEHAWFSDGKGGMELKPLTEGRPITKDDFGNLAFEKGKVKFWVEYDDESPKTDGSGGTWGGGTTISVVTTKTKTVTDPDTKEKITYDDPTVHWKGLASEANSFVFSDLTINVINVSQTDITGKVHADLTVRGTENIDLIIGDDYDNLIYGGDGDDIIFGGGGSDEIYGEGGSDVILGGDMDDILYGDYAHDAIVPDEDLDTRGNILNPEELDGDDVIIGGDGLDEIVSGDGANVVASGELSAVILNSELDNFNTFVDYDEDDIPV